jgi:prepilin-type N-terminal cleavage/methylation domain-containing protein
MQRKRGFTLVELLVVMAIIAILSSIAIPNLIGYISRSRMTAALTEIKGMELSFQKMLTDAQRDSLDDLFDADEIRLTLGYALADPVLFEEFQKTQAVYTYVGYALLRSGRLSLTEIIPEIPVDTTGDGIEDFTILNLNCGGILDRDAVNKLSTSYVEIEFDPWGGMYQIFPGPWPTRFGTGPAPHSIVFRTYMKSAAVDELPGSKQHSDVGGAGVYDIFPEDPDTGIPSVDPVNFPSSKDKVVYIYSYGANKLSGQLLFEPDESFYDPADLDGGSMFVEQEQAYMGGGDDVNNWDKNASWDRFY